MLESDDKVVGKPHDDHIAPGLPPSPAVYPKIEHVVKIDVGQQRRNHRPLARPRLTNRDDPVLQDTRLQPLLDEADDALVTDALPDETDQPILTDRIEKGANICVQMKFTFFVVIPTASASIASCGLRPGRNP